MNDHGYGNKKKAIIALTLLLMLVLPGLAGCGQKTPDIETGIAEIATLKDKLAKSTK